uniref:Transposase n=1 Tax=Heterorhabditis bacteriophora TaxID=37862 RepID=A0A1I7WAR5_HETBA
MGSLASKHRKLSNRTYYTYVEDKEYALFDRVLHRVYAEPRNACSNHFANRIFQRLYWALRAIQFRIFYNSEAMKITLAEVNSPMFK